MSPRRPSSPHLGARPTSPAGTGARGVPTPRGAGRTGADRLTSSGTGRASRSARSAAGRTGGGRGASTRPASRGGSGAAPGSPRAAAGAPAEAATRIPRIFTVRALVLFVVLLLAFVLLFPTVRAYLSQQAENRALAQEVAAARERTEDLEAELERWDDPAYVAAQARERLAFVRPGETAYRVVDPEVVPDPTAPAVPEAGTGPTLVPSGTATPWYATIWESVRVAGEAEVDAPGDPVPATPPAAVPPAAVPPAAVPPAAVPPADVPADAPADAPAP